jgi:hypothetical protein
MDRGVPSNHNALVSQSLLRDGLDHGIDIFVYHEQGIDIAMVWVYCYICLP